MRVASDHEKRHEMGQIGMFSPLLYQPSYPAEATEFNTRLAVERGVAYITSMTAMEIIDEIKRLPREEQNRVIDFLRKADEVRPLTPDELGELAKEMVEAKDPAEADRLQAEIVRGFYGGPADA